MSRPSVATCSPEFRILLRCAARTLALGLDENKGVLIHEAIDWRNLILLAFEHGMGATLAWQLKVSRWEGVPSSVQNDLQTYLSDNAMLNFRQASELAGILSELNADGIFALPLNGALLSAFLYGNLTLWDLRRARILVPSSKMRAASRIFDSKRYALTRSLGPSGGQTYLSDDKAMRVTLVSQLIEHGGTSVRPPRGLWLDGKSMSFGRHTIRMANAEACLLLLSVREGKSGCRPLRELCDISALIRKHDTLDRTKLMTLASSAGLRGKIQRSLAVTHSLFEMLVRAERCDSDSAAKKPALAAARPSARSGVAAEGGRTDGAFLGTFAPTPTEVANRMLALADVGPDDRVYDLGCGDGRLVILAAERFGAYGVGIDIDPQRIREAQTNAKDRGVAGRTTFLRHDVMTADLTRATVILLYVLFSAQLKILPKLQRELRTGTRIVSRRFGMGDWAPDATDNCVLPDGTIEPLFRWTIRN